MPPTTHCRSPPPARVFAPAALGARVQRELGGVRASGTGGDGTGAATEHAQGGGGAELGHAPAHGSGGSAGCAERGAAAGGGGHAVCHLCGCR